MAFLRANVASCWTKPWILISWCGLLVCLALQRLCGDQLLCIEAHDSSQGAHWSVSMEGIEAMVGEAERISRFEQHVMEEL